VVFIIKKVSNANITIFPPHWRAEQARTIIYKPYASTEFTLNQYNEFASIVFSSNPVCICALYRIKKKKKYLHICEIF
jgi:hypothetical protein